MRSIYLLTFFLLFSDSNQLFSQVTDHFSNTTYLNYQDKMRYYINANPDSVTIHCANMRKTGVAEYIVYADAAEAYFHALSGNTQQEKKQLILAHKKLNEISNPVRKIELEATVLNFEGSIYKHYKNYKAATRKYIRGQQIARLLKDKTLEIRFIHNLADIKAALGKLHDAIRETKMGLKLLESNKNALTEENYKTYKFNTLISLGKFYNDCYHQSSRNAWLDSTQNYYQLAFQLCTKNSYNYALVQLNMGGISLTRKDYQKSIQLFEKALLFFSTNGLVVEQKKAVYNLAIAHYETGAYPKALNYFGQFDAFYRMDSTDLLDYSNSNYFQSKIYRETGQRELAYKHSDIYLDSYEKLLRQQSDMEIDINNQITHQQYQQEMEAIRNSYNSSTSVSFWISILSLVTGCVLGLIIFKLRRDKRKIQQKIRVLSETKSTESKVKTQPKGTKSLKIDVETEQEILLKLKRLEQEHFYLRADFTLQNVARKIKTNTSYLSHVVNNNFHQTFSEYSNDLKIRYVIDKMESDSKYREFSTQAVAESVGYKNAVSFTKSFSKKTGLTPYQFSLKFKVGDTLSNPVI